MGKSWPRSRDSTVESGLAIKCATACEHDSSEQAYPNWIRRFILAGGKRHPAQMGQAGVKAFLTRLATDAQLSAGTQNQALAMLLFLPQRTAYRSASRVRQNPWFSQS